ncbi:CdaR family protein [Joostella sp. CR20]|uniref:CdaR family protein n=1 Tax=Joostella sp. CR20 TaxID=2804312 RepID=UPI00313DDEA3
MEKNIFQYIKNVLSKPKASIFLMFLVISFFLWFLISLSDTYTSHVTFKVKYIGIPEDKLILGNPKESITTNIETSGFKILNYRIFKRDLFLDLADFKQQNNAYYLLPDDVEDLIGMQYKSILVRRVEADSVVLKLGVNQKKYVKVDPEIHLSYAEDYQLKDSLIVAPDSIWVRGPEDIVASISEISTNSVEYANIQNDFDYTVALSIPDSIASELTFQTEEVSVQGAVERYSEKIILVPVQVENLPENVSLKIYPEKVKLLCKAPISELKRINEGAFKVVCDYNDISEETTLLIPELVEYPKFISSVKILDRKVEFLIKKQ